MSRLCPLAPAHVHLGVVDAERLDLDNYMTCLGLRCWDVLVDQAVKAAEFLENDSTHDEFSLSK